MTTNEAFDRGGGGTLSSEISSGRSGKRSSPTALDTFCLADALITLFAGLKSMVMGRGEELAALINLSIEIEPSIDKLLTAMI